MKKISIVTVTYNCASTIEETLLSVINQDYKNLEYIIIDGASKDDTLSIINSYSMYCDKIVTEPDRGIFDAMNKSLDYVTGEYVLFMNAGDKFVNEHIISSIFDNYSSDYDLIYGDVYIQTEFGFMFRKSKAIYNTNPSKRDLVFKSQGFCHQSLFTRADILKKIKFNLDYPLGADFDTTARVYFEGNHKIFNVGFPISIFDNRTGGASHNREKQIYAERCKMFDYELSFIDYFLIFKIILVTKLKIFLERVFPYIVKKRREKHYIKNVN